MKKVLPMMAIVAVLAVVAYLVTLWPVKVVVILLMVGCVATYYNTHRLKQRADSDQVRVFGTVRMLSPSAVSEGIDVRLSDGMKYHVIHPYPLKPNRLTRVEDGDEVQLQYYDDGMWELVEHHPRR